MDLNTKRPIHLWAEEDRPREKLVRRGINALTDAELLALILASGTRSQSAIDLGRSLLDSLGGLDGLAHADLSQLLRQNGIGKAKALAILAAFEIGKRRSITVRESKQIMTSAQAARYLHPILCDKRQEVFYLIILNVKSEIIAEKEMFSGGISSTIVDSRLIFREAINHFGSSIIVAHNHPSGSLEPSEADKKLTRELYNGAQLLDIRLVDHIIISKKGYYSFQESDKLPG